MRALFLIPALLLVAGCGSPGSPAPSTTSATPGASTEVASVTVKDFTLDPLAVTVHGDHFSLDVTNAGPTVHNVTVRDDGGEVLEASKDLREGQAEVVSLEAAPGTYVLFCSLPGHESLGIKGSLIVEP